ncbi:hypothetical protein BDV25DRAFT_136540 [Aspergillus avenaceus]|uniref:Uncharacterized protein n=1 Tax=Aspergillus avenaceus TaxID=36643 RepID=A0A5N6U5H4_ASPAV|nr:hypothetical protein BDV25DRAFT_136540 [Aspergillus avenaceus]
MISKFYPHPPYAEDQPYPHLILSTHILHRSFQAGAALGAATGLTRSALLAFRPPTPSSTTFYAKHLVPPNSSPAALFLRSTGSGAALGLVATSLMLPVYFARWELVEWQDRSWRLLENKGQVEVDDWGVLGAGAGLLGTLVVERRELGRRGAPDVRLGAVVGALGWRGALAGAGLGGVSGVLGYLGWRYGVMGGHQ